MKQTPIQTWEYKEYNNRLAVIEYCGDVLNLYPSQGKTFARSCPTKAALTQYSPLTDYKTETLLLKYLVDNHLFDHHSFTEKEARNWRFWKYLDLSKIPTITCHSTEKYNYQSILELSSEGLRGGFFNEKKNEIEFNTPLRFDNLFFEGPRLFGLLLEDRKTLRQAILDALNPIAGFTLKDTFPLFDYNKIEYQRWEFSHSNMISGEFAVMNPTHFEIGGWDNPRDGGSGRYSIENIWAKRPDFVDKRFSGANDFIEKALSNAIIKEDSKIEEKPIKTWHYRIHSNEYQLNYFKNKIVWTYFFNNLPNATTYDVAPFFKNGNSIATDKIQHELYKLLTQGDCPADLDKLGKKRWAFWQALDERKISLEQLPSDKRQLNFLDYTPYGIGSPQMDWQSLENFFFFGPKRANLPLDTRKRMRAIILTALDHSKCALSLRDAFVLFDYDKIKAMEWKCVFDNGNRGERMEVSPEGIFTMEGWEPNPYNCGGSSYSIENLWNDLGSSWMIPDNLRMHVPELKAILEAAIIVD